MTAPIETLLRESAMACGHIMLVREEDGWGACVNHYTLSPSDGEHSFVVATCSDPVDALRKALIEDERRTRDLGRKYTAAKKGSMPTQVEDLCQICDGGGCDACFKQIDIEEVIATEAEDPMAGMFG